MHVRPHRTRLVVFAAAFACFAATGGSPAAAAPWTKLHFSTGTSFNHTVAVGDLNVDGQPDVAIPNSQLNAVTVFLMADVCTPLPVSRVVAWADIRPTAVERMASRGCVFGSAMDAFRAYPDLFSSWKAADHALRRAPAYR